MSNGTSDGSGIRPPLGLSAQARLAITVVLACALLVAVVGGIVLSARYVEDKDATASPSLSAEGAEGSAQSAMAGELQTRREVQSSVETFVANLNNYSVNDIEGYRGRLKPLMTTGFAQSFDLAVDNIVSQVKATKMTSKGEVLRSAVSSLDPDNATALVVADSHVTSALGERLRHFRWRVTLVRQGDTWFVDQFEPVE